jgi:hypothetical protein
MKRLGFTILWSTILFVVTSSAETNPIRVLLLDGQSAGPYHNWQLTTPVLKKELEDTGRFRVTVTTSLSLEATSAVSSLSSANIK